MLCKKIPSRYGSINAGGTGMILEEIAARTRMRMKAEQNRLSLAELRRLAEELPHDSGFPFEQALKKPGLSVICEVKKASPSKGVIAEQFPYLEIAREYEAAGAAAISVLTEPYYFQGSDRYLEEVAKAVSVPVLRKDFTIAPYMIYQAKVSGAAAVLLICTILEDGELKEYGDIAESLGMSVLIEAHDEAEVERALKINPRILGVNNRNLKTFQVDVSNSVRLRKLVPPEVLYVSESGISGKEDTRILMDNGTDAVLIGETLMRSADKRSALHALRWKEREI